MKPVMKKVYRVRWKRPYTAYEGGLKYTPYERHFLTNRSAQRFAKKVAKGGAGHTFDSHGHPPAKKGSVRIDVSYPVAFPVDELPEISDEEFAKQEEEKHPPVVVQGISISYGSLKIGQLEINDTNTLQLNQLKGWGKDAYAATAYGKKFL